MRRIGTPWKLLVILALAACGGDRPAGSGDAPDAEPPVAGPMEGWYARADGFSFGGDELQVLREPVGFGFRTSHGGIAFREVDVRNRVPFGIEAIFEQRLAGAEDQGAFGIFVGGRQVLADAQEYVAFLVRSTGEFAVLRWVRGEVTPIVDWTRTAAMRQGSGTSRNVLVLEADREEVRFRLNGDLIARLGAALVDPTGAVGVRVDEGLSLSITGWVVQ